MELTKLEDFNEPKLIKTLLSFRHENHFCFHGKEPLAELGRIERVTRKIWRKGIRFSVQTNGVLLDERAAEFLVEWDFSVGISLDGPAELNVLRCDERATQKIEKNVKRFIQASENVGIISVITKLNASNPKRFAEWVMEWDSYGIKSWRFNPVAFHSELRPPDGMLIEFYEAMSDLPVLWSPIQDVFKPSDEKTCTWKGCDWEASRVPTVLPNGEITSCMKTKNYYTKWSNPIGTRVEYLKQTSISEGGCKNCEYWDLCKGSCPREAKDRFSRSDYCKVWRALFATALRKSSFIANIGSYRNREECPENLDRK